MNRSTLIIVACGFFFALLAAASVQMLGSKGRDEKPAQTQMADVLVAAKDIPIGGTLDASTTQWAPWPKSAVFAGAIVRQGQQTPAEALEGRTRRAVAKGEPMLKAAMIDDKQSNFVAASLSSGHRAVAINVNAQSSVAGFVTPGDRVDVVLTYDVKLPSDEELRKAAMPVINRLAAETILENVRVLASDQQIDRKEQIKVGKTVTLEVTPQQAEILILAGRMGTLSLMLRSIGDTSPAQEAAITTDMRVSGVMREILKGENKSGRLSQVVRIYSGTRVENVEVRPFSHVQ